jgi:predicted  nucleic acid-binding Zn-ribbon protein
MNIEEERNREEKIFELNEQIKYLRGQATYLQEELSSVEDELQDVRARLNHEIDNLEKQLEKALSWDNQ